MSSILRARARLGSSRKAIPPRIFFEAGAPRSSSSSPRRGDGVLDRLEIWGQPRAWTDELISTWVVEFIKREIGHALVFADCLASQWTSGVLLRAWLEGIIWAPYAPEVTSWLQEPDTHEHSQLKSLIRAVKSELHFALEHEYLRECKRVGSSKLKLPTSWGPFECLHVISEAYGRFQAKFKEQVPLEGLQANQMLRVRPSTEGTLELVQGTEEWSFNTMPGRGIPGETRRPARPDRRGLGGQRPSRAQLGAARASSLPRDGRPTARATG